MCVATRVEARPGYRPYLEFSDGVAGEIELRDRLYGPVFEPLLDEQLFLQVTLDEFGVAHWPNGADLAPDALHDQIERLGLPRE